MNIISSDFPGEKADSAFRYQRSREVVEILKQAWTQDEINYQAKLQFPRSDNRSGQTVSNGRTAFVFWRIFTRSAGTMRTAL